MRPIELQSPGCGTGAEAMVNLQCNRYINNSRFFLNYQTIDAPLVDVEGVIYG
jgi:hypothetical protein